MSSVRNWPGYLAEVRRPMHAAVVYQFRQYASCLRRPPRKPKNNTPPYTCVYNPNPLQGISFYQVKPVTRSG